MFLVYDVNVTVENNLEVNCALFVLLSLSLLLSLVICRSKVSPDIKKNVYEPSPPPPPPRKREQFYRLT